MLALLILQATAQAPLSLPADWAALPPLPYLAVPTVTPVMDQFVAGEIAAGRCRWAKPADGHYAVPVEIAVLIGADGGIRKLAPRAIGCPTVEQYSVGLVSSFVRGNLTPRLAPAEQWYRAMITYDWHG